MNLLFVILGNLYECLFMLLVIRIVIGILVAFGKVNQLFELVSLLGFLFLADSLLFSRDFGIFENLEVKRLLSELAFFLNIVSYALADKLIDDRINRRA